jgi:8-oxo-dGTP diphosphatase
MKKIVRVGFGVYVLKNGKVLLGKRIGDHGKGYWSAPGGHLEYGESWEEGARRETFEEAGIKIKNIRLAGLTSDIHEDEKKHYVTIALAADYNSGDVKIMEPEKLERWEWFEWDKLPEPLFIPMQNILNQGFNPFEK